MSVQTDSIRSLFLAIMLAFAPDVRADGIPTGTDPEWWPAAQAAIARSEYHASPSVDGSDGFTHGAPNRAQAFRTRFGPQGIELVPRGPDADPWRLSMSTVAIGRGRELAPVGKATLSTAGARVDLARDGITEWYGNGPRGLKQSFEIAERPAPAVPSPVAVPEAGEGVALPTEAPARTCPVGGDAARAPICVVLEYDGNLAPRVAADGLAIEFARAGGRPALRYAGLVVQDASGRELPSRLALAEDAVLIVVDDADAMYPLTVDPLFTTADWTLDGTQEGSELGTAVATAGDVNGDGYSDVLVAAPYFDNGQTNEGRVLLFDGSAAGLGTTPAWQAEGNQVGASFGYAVATAGDVNGDGYADVAIGAPYFDLALVDEGAVFVYHGGKGGLPAAASWTSSGGQAGARFGVALASAADTQGDGYSDLVVGAPYFDNGQVDEGRAFLFLGTSSGLGAIADWTAESNQANARYAEAVAWAGDVNADGRADVIVGAPLADNGQTDEGRVFVFFGTERGLNSKPDWQAESNESGAHFGTAVATAGDVNGDGYADVAVGAPDHDQGGLGEIGRAFVYHGSASQPSTTPSWAMYGLDQLERFGAAITTAGDVNGDGYADLAVGAPGVEQDAGAVRVYHGSPAGLGNPIITSIETGETGARLGASLALAGDVDGDGYSDLLIGWPGLTSGQFPEGRVTLHRGASDGLATAPAWTRDETQAGAQFGLSVAAAGDVDGDGFDDVLVGAPNFAAAGPGAGRAFVFLGVAGGLATSPAWFADGAPGASFGYAAAGAFDANGDGYADIAIGSPNYYDVQHPRQVGRGDIFFGGPGGPSATPGCSVFDFLFYQLQPPRSQCRCDRRRQRRRGRGRRLRRPERWGDRLLRLHDPLELAVRHHPADRWPPVRRGIRRVHRRCGGHQPRRVRRRTRGGAGVPGRRGLELRAFLCVSRFAHGDRDAAIGVVLPHAGRRPVRRATGGRRRRGR